MPLIVTMAAFIGFVSVLLASAEAAPPAIPDLATWESQMLSFGATHCNKLQDASVSGDAKLAETYYDSERVFYQIYEYTRDPRWLGCAQSAEQVYRNGYVISNDGAVPAYWMFPHGIWYDWKRTADSVSQSALLELANRGGFAYAPLAWTASTDSSREVAYNVMTKLLAQDVGYADASRLNDLVTQAFDHMNQWFVAKSAPYIRPFMVALTSEALITYYRRTGDTRVLPAVQMAMDWLWEHTWLPADGAFMYTDRVAPDGSGDMSPAPDLNLLIGPVYGWLYYMTGDSKYQVEGDTIFSAGVRKGPAFIYLGKQYNQNYRWSFDYVYWRQNGVSPVYARVGSFGPSGGAPAGSAAGLPAFSGAGGTGASAPSTVTPTPVPTPTPNAMPPPTPSTNPSPSTGSPTATTGTGSSISDSTGSTPTGPNYVDPTVRSRAFRKR